MDLVVVGRVGAPHGVSGAFRITSSTDPPENIERYRPWLLGRDGDYHEVQVCSVKPLGQGFVVRLRGVIDRDQAQALSGLDVAVPRGALPELVSDREYYWRDLIGMSVRNAGGRDLGTVRDLIPTGAHDVLVIDDGRRETLVPFADAFLVEVNVAERTLVVDWQDPL